MLVLAMQFSKNNGEIPGYQRSAGSGKPLSQNEREDDKLTCSEWKFIPLGIQVWLSNQCIN
jgi:hypothetical protein